jgi:hypothetical protein
MRPCRMTATQSMHHARAASAEADLRAAQARGRRAEAQVRLMGSTLCTPPPPLQHTRARTRTHPPPHSWTDVCYRHSAQAHGASLSLLCRRCAGCIAPIGGVRKRRLAMRSTAARSPRGGRAGGRYRRRPCAPGSALAQPEQSAGSALMSRRVGLVGLLVCLFVCRSIGYTWAAKKSSILRRSLPRSDVSLPTHMPTRARTLTQSPARTPCAATADSLSRHRGRPARLRYLLAAETDRPDSHSLSPRKGHTRELWGTHGYYGGTGGRRAVDRLWPSTRSGASASPRCSTTTAWINTITLSSNCGAARAHPSLRRRTWVAT